MSELEVINESPLDYDAHISYALLVAVWVETSLVCIFKYVFQEIVISFIIVNYIRTCYIYIKPCLYPINVWTKSLAFIYAPNL